jgi:hypothetical protein
VARWDGTHWTIVGSPGEAPPIVLALYVWHDALVAAGWGPVEAWDGAAWRSLGSASIRAGAALGEYAGDLMLGGSFTSIGEKRMNGIARWDGSDWNYMGSIGGIVHAFLNDGGTIYAGGEDISGPNYGIARWDSTEWHILGSGVESGYVAALAMYHGDLYAGGGFRVVGGKHSAFIARWLAATPPGPTVADVRFLAVKQNYPNPFQPTTNIRFEVRSPQRVRVTIYDVAGRLVARILDSDVAPGTVVLPWDGRTASGRAAASGTYFYEVRTPTARGTRRMQIIR